MSEAPRGPEDERRASATLGRLQLVVVTAWASFALVNIVLARAGALALNAAAIGLTLSTWLFARARPAQWRLAMHVSVLISCAAIVLSSWSTGGVQGIAWWYFAAAPLFAAHVGGRRTGAVWTVLAAIGVLLACLVQVGPTEFIPTDADRVFGGVLLVVICAAFGLLAREAADEHLAAVAEAARARGELLATIGHEVRTPLHGMVGTAAILDDTNLGTEQREMLRTIQASGKALKKIVDDVLEVARLEAGQLRIDPHAVDLLSVIEDVVDLFGSDAAAKNLMLLATVEGAPHMRVEVDGNRVRQILTNLVGNAVKFTEKGHIAVRADAEPEGDLVAIRVAVEDTGPGVPEETIAELFQAFRQPDAKLARIHGGSGLGLSLSRHLAERMGGSLTAEAGRAVGACFELSLRVPPASPSKSRRRRRPIGTVLLLQRDPLEAEAFLSTARALGARARVVATLEEALDAIAQEQPFVTIVSGSSEADPEATRVALRRALGGECPIVLSFPQDRVGSYLATEIARSFDGTTLEPVRRSRLRALLDEARLAHGSRPTPLLLGRAVVLDDDPTSRRLMSVMLERRGYVVTPCAHGEEALARLSEGEFEMVVCDLNMPGMDGVEVIRAARKLGSTRDTIFVCVSASVREEDRLRCLRAGFAGYLTKPFDPPQLDELIARARRRSSLEMPAVVVPRREVSDEGAAVDAATVERLRELLGDEMDLVLRELWDSTLSHIEDLRTGTREKSGIARAAHTIASGALQMGLTALGERARALELAVDERSQDEVLAEADRLAALLARSFRELGLEDTLDDADGPDRRIKRIRFQGHLDPAMVERELARATRTGGEIDRLLVDCAAMSSYDPEARQSFEQWAAQHGSLRGMAFVTRNRLWGGVVRAMSVASGTSMRSFWSVSEAETWLGELS